MMYDVKVEFWSKYDPKTDSMNAHRTLYFRTYTVSARTQSEAQRKADDKALGDSSADIMERYTVGEAVEVEKTA